MADGNERDGNAGGARYRKAVAAVGLAGALIGGATACDLEPGPTLVVTTTVDGADVVPGDGVCEITAGSGDCSLRAAIDEGNALGIAVLSVPAGDYAGAPLTVTGALRMNLGAAAEVRMQQSLTVAAGGELQVEGVELRFSQGGTWTVHGTLFAHRVRLGGIGVPSILTVSSTGVAVVGNSLVAGAYGGPSVRNDGTFVAGYSFIEGVAQVPLATGAGATSTLIGTVVSSPTFQQQEACQGPDPISLGSNLASDETCGLSEPGDLVGPTGVSTTFDAESRPSVAVSPTSPAIDAIPIGVASCGSDVVQDLEGALRPIDGDGDGTDACDIGAAEVPATP